MHSNQVFGCQNIWWMGGGVVCLHPLGFERVWEVGKGWTKLFELGCFYSAHFKSLFVKKIGK